MLRNPKRMGRWIVIAVAIGLFSSSQALAKKPVKPPAPEEPVTYTMVELPGAEGDANAITQLNGSVEIVGRLFDSSGEEKVGRAHYWMLDSAGEVLLTEDLQTLPPLVVGAMVHSDAMCINSHGVIVGYQRDGPGGPPRPLLWPDAASVPIELPTTDGISGGTGSINDAGIVVGITYNSDDSANLVAWNVVAGDGAAIVLDAETILTADINGPGNVSNSGYVACSIADQDGSYCAVRLKLGWGDGQVWEVEGSRTQLFDVYSPAFDVNEAGTVCGKHNPDGAYAMNVDGELLELPTLPGGRLRGQRYDIRNADANALNSAASLQVVGIADIVITETHEWRGMVPVLWNVGGDAIDLSSVAVEQTPWPMDINDAGWIVGQTFELRQPVVLIPSQ